MDSYITRISSKKTLQSVKNDLTIIREIFRKNTMPYDKMMDGRCGQILGFDYVNMANNGPDCLGYDEKQNIVFFENKRNNVPTKAVVLEDTSDLKAELFLTQPNIYLCSSAIFPPELTVDGFFENYFKNVQSEDANRFKKDLTDAIKNPDPLFQVFGKTTMLPKIKKRGTQEKITLLEYTHQLGQQRRNVSYSLSSLVRAGFVIISGSLSTASIKVYFKSIYPRAFKYAKFVELKDFNKYSKKGNFDYFLER